MIVLRKHFLVFEIAPSFVLLLTQNFIVSVSGNSAQSLALYEGSESERYQIC